MTLLVAAATFLVDTGPGHAQQLNCSVGGGSHDILTGEGVIFSTASSGTVTESLTTLDFGDGSTGSHTLDTSATHYYETPGTYTVTFSQVGRVNVVYADGTPGNEPCTSQGVWGVVTVHELEPAFSSRVADDGLRVDFDASASRDAGIISGYSWTFGDGTSGSGQRVTHRYRKPGRYAVQLRVESAYGGARTTSALDLPRAVGAGTNAEGDAGGVSTPLLFAGGLVVLGVAGFAALKLRASRHAVDADDQPTDPRASDPGGSWEMLNDDHLTIQYAQTNTLTDATQEIVEKMRTNVGSNQDELQQKINDGTATAEDYERYERQRQFGADAAQPTAGFVKDGVYTSSTDLPTKGLSQVFAGFFEWVGSFKKK